VNEVAPFTVKIASAYALDPSLRGDSSQVSFVLEAVGTNLPWPGLAALLGAGLIAAVLALRRGGRR
jgi:hypothetical protein